MQTRSRWSLLFGVMAMFLLAAPAMAQAVGPYWYDNQELIGEKAEEQPIVLNGTVSVNISGSPVVAKCETEGSGFIWNEGISGEGTVYASAWGPCPTNLPGCTMSATNSTELPETEWPITTAVGEESPEVSIEEIAVNLIGSEFCKTTYGLWGFGFSGTLVGEYNNKTHLLEFINAKPGSGAVINGETTLEVIPWETLTLE